MDVKSGQIVLQSSSVQCLMCLNKLSKLEFVQVTNEFITELYNFHRNEYRLKLINQPYKQLFADMNDFKDRVTSLVTDYFKEEDQVPNYFRNMSNLEQKNGMVKNWTLTSSDKGFLRSVNYVCIECFTKGNEIR